MPSNLFIEQFQLGPMDNFQYFLGDETTGEIAVVDPAWDVKFLVEEAKRKNYKIKAVFLTHGHPDHVNGLAPLLQIHDVPAYISKAEASFYIPKHPNIKLFEPDAVLKIGSVEFQCLHTPGHTPGCECFLSGKHLITGDTLFIDGCGRCDLPGGDAKVMYESLYNVLKKLPDDTVVYPGHNYGPTPTDTMGNQKKTNPYLQCRSLGEFLSERMGFSV